MTVFPVGLIFDEIKGFVQFADIVVVGAYLAFNMLAPMAEAAASARLATMMLWL